MKKFKDSSKIRLQNELLKKRLQDEGYLFLPGLIPKEDVLKVRQKMISILNEFGWIDNSYLDTVRAAWTGIKERIDEEGNIVDGCTGSGVMDNRLSYLDRPANSGYDDRSGSMALWFAAEIANLNR